jgi:hypothetical protein
MHRTGESQKHIFTRIVCLIEDLMTNLLILFSSLLICDFLV